MNNKKTATDKSTSLREELGNKLREMRNRRGLTLLQVSEMSGIGVSYISKIERGMFAGSIDTFGRLASVLGARVNITTTKSRIKL